MRRPVLIRALVLCLLCGLALPAAAQEAGDATQEAGDAPIIRTELDPAEVLTGQPTTLRVTVLVPSFFSRPVALPSYDLPNVLVELPEASGRPVSERVAGRKWSGVRQEYRITPLVPGPIALPPQEVAFTYADSAYKPVEATARTAALTLTGLVPAAAAGLDPFLAARAVTLEQEIEGAEGELQPGAAITRRVIATIEGGRAMAIPPLLLPLGQPGLSEHPDPPVVETDADADPEAGSEAGSDPGRGIRSESVTYIVKQGGRYELPEIRLGWYDIAADRVDELVLEGVALAVSGPVAAAAGPARDWRRLAAIVAGAILLGLLALLLIRRARPAVARGLRRARAARRASPRYARRQAERALQAHRLGAALTWTRRWWQRAGHAGPPPAPLTAAYLEIGRALYGPDAASATPGVRAPAESPVKTATENSAPPAAPPTGKTPAHSTSNNTVQPPEARWSFGAQALRAQARGRRAQRRSPRAALPELNPPHDPAPNPAPRPQAQDQP